MRHRGRGQRGELGRRPRDPVPGPDDEGDRRRVRARPCAARSTSTRTGASMSYDAGGPTCSTERRSRSTTRRCATGRSSRASRSPSRTSCASPSSSTGSACTTSRRAGPAPTRRTTSCSAARRTELQLDDAHARGLRVDPPGEGQGRQRRHAAPPRRGQRRHGVHRRQVVGLPRHRGAAARRSTRAWRWSPTRSSSCAARAWTCSSTPSTSSTATSATPSSRCACSRRPRPRARRHVVLCDTNGGALPHEVERIVARGRAPTSVATCSVGGPPPRRRRHRRGQRAGRRARRRDPGAGHDQRLRRAHRQLQPHRRSSRTSR